MDILQVGNVVKSTSSDDLMVINSSYVDKSTFTKGVLDYLHDNEIDESNLYRYVCFVENADGTTKKLEFKRDELIFVRTAY